MKILNRFIILVLFVVLLFTSGSVVSAFEVVNRQDLKLDDALAEQQVLYSQPMKIYISQVHVGNEELKNNSKGLIRAIYYYSITRLKLNDIPYNYLIDGGGNVYEVSKGGVGANPGLQGGENIVLIGLLSDGSSLTPRVSTSLEELVETLSYRYGIVKGSWDFVDLKIVSKESQRSYMVAQKSLSSLRTEIDGALSSVKWSDAEHLEYKASIESVEYPEEIEIGKQLPVKVKVMNENDFPWFLDKKYVYISTENGKESPYAINSVWQSFSKPAYIEGKYLAPGDSIEVNFLMAAKNRPGEYGEKFVFTKDVGSLFEGSKFEVKFKIVAGSHKLVEVVSPEYGFVNIRDCRWYSCKKVEVANDGDVFITTKKEEGWYEIVYKEGSLGWVYQKYIKEL
ncbi:MAG: hypothetical protein ACOX0X_01295 [Candidatus Dojkabacteria bacterium]